MNEWTKWTDRSPTEHDYPIWVYSTKTDRVNFQVLYFDDRNMGKSFFNEYVEPTWEKELSWKSMDKPEKPNHDKK